MHMKGNYRSQALIGLAHKHSTSLFITWSATYVLYEQHKLKTHIYSYGDEFTQE